MADRIARLTRKTSETDISVRLKLDGRGNSHIDTGIKFLDHMLTLFAKHGLFDVNLKAKGDLNVDIHHTNEDVGLSLGEAFKKALGDKKGIRRFGYAYVPMDEALVRVVVDISGRPYLLFKVQGERFKVGASRGEVLPRTSHLAPRTYTLDYARQFVQAFATNSGITMYVDMLYGEDMHHILEATFKAFSLALSQAAQTNPRMKGIPSTKGRL